jgi:hypothetical protein
MPETTAPEGHDIVDIRLPLKRNTPPANPPPIISRWWIGVLRWLGRQ